MREVGSRGEMKGGKQGKMFRSVKSIKMFLKEAKNKAKCSKNKG